LINREDALILLGKYLKNKNLVKHCLAVEAGMRELAAFFKADPERWGMAGLLHDIDYDLTADSPERHGEEAMDILSREDSGLDEDMMYAIRAHSGHHPLKSDMDRALYAADPLTGLIVASALMHPEKKIGLLDTEFVMRRYGEKSFAKGAKREIIATCESFMPLEDFVSTVLSGMKGIDKELGL